MCCGEEVGIESAGVSLYVVNWDSDAGLAGELSEMNCTRVIGRALSV